MKTQRNLIHLCLLCVALLSPLASGATTLVVTNTADAGPGTLRQLIASATAGSTVTFATNLSGATITLTGGQLNLTNNVTIDASALTNGVQINGSGTSRIFNMTNGNTVVLTALTITNGAALASSAGGGIFINGGTLTLNQCTLAGNYSTNANAGGGIYDFNSTLTLNQCTLTGNYSAYLGGGIYNYSSMLTLNQCTMLGNYTTFSGTGGGGGIYNFGTLMVNQSTLTGNYSDNDDGAGGIYNYGGTTLFNSIVAGNGAPSDASGADIVTDTFYITMNGTNIVPDYVQIYGGTFSGTTPLTNNPQLGPPGNYGGLTQTMPPLPGSPAIDAGSDSATNLFATDQRGYPRRAGQHVDIGAMELQTPFLMVTTNADSGPGSLRQIISQMDVSATITFTNTLSRSTIALTSGQLTLSNCPTIDASALTNGIQINGDGAARIFYVTNGAIAVLTALTIANGRDLTAAGGGGIYNSGSLTVDQCTLAGNIANNASGGGIYNKSILVINQSTLTANMANNALANGGGGGIYNGNGLLMVNQCTLTGNHSDNDTTGNGGGGGIYNGNGLVFVNQSTLTGNHSDNDVNGGGGGIYTGTGNLNIMNSIVAGNSAINGSGSGDIFNIFNFNVGGANIIQNYQGTAQGPTPIHAAPQLAALGNYGGFTQTMPPLPGSPAINACFNTGNFTNDQRDVPRLPGGIADIGSVKLAPPTVATLPATAVVSSNATLNATVNLNTLAGSAWFQWGVTNNPYSNQTTPVGVGGGNTARAFSNNLTSLMPGAVYHCRVAATNVDGSTNGNDVLFASAPVVTLIGPASMTNECHTFFTDPGATNVAGLPVTVAGRVNTNSPNTYQLTYTATNSLGLAGTAIRIVTVVDTTPPVITLLGNNPMTVLTNAPFVDPGATALDACGGSFIVTATNNVNPAVAGSYVVAYSSMDSYNNTATAVRTVVVRTHLVFVTTTNDSGSGSLRQAIASSYAGDTIQFAANLSGAAILLTSGQLALSNSVGIDASALPGGIQINGNTNDRIFMVVSNATVALTALTITNGYGVRAVMFTNFCGGGIFNEGTVTLNQCTLTGNHADYDGSFSSGGGGGGIYNEGTLTVNQCTLTENHADNDFYGGGGGIYNQDTLTVNQSTLTGNHADNGTQSGGGGIVDFAGFTIYNSIVAGNSATNNVGADIASQDPIFNGANIAEDVSFAVTPSGSTPINAAPQLAALGNYGGPTQTMPPLPGSPAIDACDSSTFTTDQRGFPRFLGSFPDIGAVEGIYNTNGPGKLAGLKRLDNGSTQFTFTNYTDGSSTVLASTNVALPLNLWINLGAALESPIGSGQFQFTDPQATNYLKRFYRVRTP